MQNVMLTNVTIFFANVKKLTRVRVYNKLGLSCAKLSTAKASYTLA